MKSIYIISSSPIRLRMPLKNQNVQRYKIYWFKLRLFAPDAPEIGIGFNFGGLYYPGDKKPTSQAHRGWMKLLVWLAYFNRFGTMSVTYCWWPCSRETWPNVSTARTMVHFWFSEPPFSSTTMVLVYYQFVYWCCRIFLLESPIGAWWCLWSREFSGTGPSYKAPFAWSKDWKNLSLLSSYTFTSFWYPSGVFYTISPSHAVPRITLMLLLGCFHLDVCGGNCHDWRGRLSARDWCYR